MTTQFAAIIIGTGQSGPALADLLLRRLDELQPAFYSTDEDIIMKAIWKETVLAESDRVETVEGNAYFPPDSIKREYLRPTDAHTVCPWKGVANYYDVVVNGAVNKEAAWYYPEPKQAAAKKSPVTWRSGRE